MHPILRNIAAIILGVSIGATVNMGVILLSPYIISPPEGADVTTVEGLKASIHLFQPYHFLMPFLAHALGSLVAGCIAAFIAADSKMNFAIAVGFFFMLGGVANVVLLPAPMWFNILDLTAAYIPMGYLGYVLYDKWIK